LIAKLLKSIGFITKLITDEIDVVFK